MAFYFSMKLSYYLIDKFSNILRNNISIKVLVYIKYRQLLEYDEILSFVTYIVYLKSSL